MAGFLSWSNGEAPRNGHDSQGGSLFRNKVISGRVTKPSSSDKKKILEDSGVDIEEQGSGGSQVEDEDVVDSIEEDDDSGESNEPAEKPLIQDPIAFLARVRNPSEDNPSEPSSQETNVDYDPEEGWRYEQVFLNQILKGRDEYTLMPTTWRMHFRGIPFPEGLFYIRTQAVSVRPRIYARTDRLEYRGAIALRRLIDLHSRIRDIRKAEKQDPNSDYSSQIVKQTRRRLMDALRWAELDGDIDKYKPYFPSNVRILEMEDLDRLDMDLHIQEEMNDLAEQWRRILAGVPEDERPTAPVLFGFVIFRHILFIVTVDAQDPAAVCHIPCQLNLSERNQHQWNALAIMVTVCWARDLFRRLADNFEIPGHDSGSGRDSDPDA
ncbi:hypothetical protein F5Y06DRAFT_261694 [Hypoxylon sp. FL0890]|nr:hypothetical protein F5Y06DRAFT_261694 [Hypoxylon sp. FL0890]